MRISLIIPAYNEEGRLPKFLRDLGAWHAAHPGVIAEIFVVDDGSSDGTDKVAQSFADHLPLRVIRLPRNRGKGASVQAGVKESHGDVVIFMDADGATPPSELPKMLMALRDSPIAVGNRWMPGSRVANRDAFRAFSGWIYRRYVGLFGLAGVDTMCGFKGFRTDVARTLFARLTNERWLFDTEIMVRARRHGYAVAAIPIFWTSKHGSKLRPAALLNAFFQIPFLVARVRREG